MSRLRGRPLNPELAAAHEQGLDAVKAYLSTSQGRRSDRPQRGEADSDRRGGSGKTSLLDALRGDEWVENRPTTHGVEVDIKSLVLDVPDDGRSYRRRTVDDDPQTVEDDDHDEDRGLATAATPTTITLNGWDFGGQNIHRHTHQLFFTALAVYLAVWNPRRGPGVSRVHCKRREFLWVHPQFSYEH